MSKGDKAAEKTSAVLKMLVTVGQYNRLTLLFISHCVLPYLWINEMTTLNPSKHAHQVHTYTYAHEKSSTLLNPLIFGLLHNSITALTLIFSNQQH